MDPATKKAACTEGGGREGRGGEGSGDRLSLAAFGVRLIEAVECESEVSARSTSQRPSTVSILRIGRRVVRF